jgi:hypothetical protein
MLNCIDRTLLPSRLLHGIILFVQVTFEFEIMT